MHETLRGSCVDRGKIIPAARPLHTPWGGAQLRITYGVWYLGLQPLRTTTATGGGAFANTCQEFAVQTAFKIPDNRLTHGGNAATDSAFRVK